MAQCKPGTRLKSAVCNSEVMVVLASAADVELAGTGVSTGIATGAPYSTAWSLPHPVVNIPAAIPVTVSRNSNSCAGLRRGWASTSIWIRFSG